MDHSALYSAAATAAALLVLFVQYGNSDVVADEARVLDECLKRYGGLRGENVQRVARYSDWSPHYEEIPCFTDCYLAKMFDFYNATHGFEHERVKARYGAALYAACRARLEFSEPSCELAYRGFHCLIELENDPFIYIDNASRLDAEAKSAIKSCLSQVARHDQSLFMRYAQFPVYEPIRCLTRCFVLKLNLYDESSATWQLARLRSMFGYLAEEHTLDNCMLYEGLHSCDQIYQELTCFALQPNRS